MGTILEALAVIKGKDATGGAFDAVAAKINRISRAANALNRDVQKQLSMAAVAERQAGRMERATSMIGSGAKMAATYGGAHLAIKTVERAARVAAAQAHEETRMRVAGMKDSEIKDAEDLSGALSMKYPALAKTDIMHAARNARSIVGSFEEAAEILEPMMKLKVIAFGAHPEKVDELNEEFDKLIKGEEIKGITQNLPRFVHGMDMMAKAVNVFGDTLRPTDFYETVKYSRQAAVPLSDRFMLETAPTLAQELGGSGTGKALSTFYGTVIGGKMKDVAAREFVKYGLADPDKIVKTKTGAVKGLLPNGIKEGRLASEDPYAWVNDVFLPALAKQGVTDPKEIQDHIATMFRDSTAAQMVGIFATQQKRIEKDWDLIRKAHGLEAADEFQKNDPKVIRKAISSQADNILSNTAGPLVPTANAGMNWLVSGEQWLAERSKSRPGDTFAAGTWLGAMMGAASLDSLGWLSEKVLGRGGSPGLSKAVGSMAPVLALTQLADNILDDDDVNRLKRYEASPRYRFDQLHDLDEKDKAAGIYGDPDFEAYVKAQTSAKRAALNGELGAFGYNPAITSGRYQAGGPGWSIDDIRKATGIGGAGEPAEAKIVGEATLKTEVTVSPSPDFLARVSQTVQNGINAFRSTGAPATGSSGSTGRSMPEAGPPQ